ncbi:hypothetical protein LINGRAHAP2_LOCUS32171 [Linum grandiflorum]
MEIMFKSIHKTNTTPTNTRTSIEIGKLTSSFSNWLHVASSGSISTESSLVTSAAFRCRTAASCWREDNLVTWQVAKTVVAKSSSKPTCSGCWCKRGARLEGDGFIFFRPPVTRGPIGELWLLEMQGPNN